MESWAKSILGAQFLCVCVESRRVAIAFHQMFEFEQVTNAYIPSRGYMPVGYGQLGCSGFIVSDKNGCFVSRKTRAYLQYGEAAFRDVESILDNLIPKASNTETELTEAKQPVTSTKDIKKEDLFKKVELPPSVGVDAMDDEHKECTESFNKVIENPSLANLKQLFNILQVHFDHEEEIMEQYSGKSGNSSFSSINSHRMDHERILNIAKVEVERMTVKKSPCESKGQ